MHVASAYLQRLERKGFSCDETDPAHVLERLRSLIGDTENLSGTSLEEFESAITAIKNEYTISWAQLELNKNLTHEERGLLWSQFADASLDAALQVAWRHVAGKHKALNSLIDQPLKGLFVLGLGKLGGKDLNFSSDVDLIAYFDPETFPVPSSLGIAFIAHQVLQTLTKSLSRSGGLDFVWRVDWRLRPNASANTLAMSVPAAQQYYFYQASPWHRLALLKARPVAGDIDAGTDFLESLHPFIWRQNLDYRSLDELAEIKHRINLEHPSLRSERAWQELIQDDVAGFNVKLGSGGIREIEFVVNAMQLIWGGRKPSLQTTNTMRALDVLTRAALVDSDTSVLLNSAYSFLRRLENGLQLLDNAHTHLIPTDESTRSKLQLLLSIESWPDFVAQLNEYRRGVNLAFSELFASQDTELNQPIVWPPNLSSRSDEIIEIWESGYHAYGVSIEARTHLRPLTLGLSRYLTERRLSEQDIEATIVRLHDYFRRLPKGEQYFRLLAQTPELLDSVITPLRDSPAMTILLEQSPHIIDRYLERVWRYPDDLPNPDDVLVQPTYDAQLDSLRRFVNEHLYQIYWQFLQGQISVKDFQAGLTLLAERALQCAVKLVCDELELNESPVSIIALGKLGLSTMAPMSDLDLVFVFDEEQVELTHATHFVSRLQTAISSKMKEGVVYELDTRLRPSGRSGAPTVSVASLKNHHLTRAHTWEHIAFMFARPILASAHVEKAVNELKSELLTRRRDPHQLLGDVEAMWKRIDTHRVSSAGDEIYNSKLRPGGLMQYEFYAAANLLIASDSTPNDLDYAALIEQRLAPEIAKKALEGMQYWRTLQIYERLLGLEGVELERTPKRYKQQLLAHMGVSDIPNLVELNKSHAHFAQSVLRAPFVGEAASYRGFSDTLLDVSYTNDAGEWIESAVNWCN